MTDETLRAVLARHRDELVLMPGVVGVSEAEVDGRPCIAVYITERSAGILERIPADLEGWPVVVRASGEFRALTD